MRDLHSASPDFARGLISTVSALPARSRRMLGGGALLGAKNSVLVVMMMIGKKGARRCAEAHDGC